LLNAGYNRGYLHTGRVSHQRPSRHPQTIYETQLSTYTLPHTSPSTKKLEAFQEQTPHFTQKNPRE
jgi:hypothetical protein